MEIRWRLTRGCAGEVDAEPGAEIAAGDAHDADQRHQPEMEVRGEIDLEADVGEKQRHEQGVDHLGDDAAGVLGQALGFADHDAGEEEAEQGVDAQFLGDGAEQQAQQERHGQRTGRLGELRAPSWRRRSARRRGAQAVRTRTEKPSGAGKDQQDRAEREGGLGEEAEDDGEEDPPDDVVHGQRGHGEEARDRS